jgi:hypothetical protein
MWNKERCVQAFLACVTMLFGLSFRHAGAIGGLEFCRIGRR